MPSRRRSRNKSIAGNITDVQKRLRYLETRPAPSQLAKKVVATKNIFKGEKLSSNNIFLRRPGNGDYRVKDFIKILGKKVKKNIKKNTQIQKKHLV